jgi:hypothetical protein
MKRDKFIAVIVFGIAFAFVEAAIVVYLRHLLSIGIPHINKNEILILAPGIAFLDPKAALEIIKSSSLLRIEQAREIATIVILASLAFIAGKKWLEKGAYFLLSFGIWDLFYYFFLSVIIGWPRSLGDLDIFFLVPVPWVGPVVTPILISIVLILLSIILLIRVESKDREG